MSGAFDFSPDPSNPLESGLGMANAYLGNVKTYKESDKAQTSQSHYRDLEFYAQDSWRVTRRLTLDIGARFQNISPTYWPGQQAAIFDPSLYDASKAMKYIYPIAGGMGKNPYTDEIVSGTYVGTYAMPAGVTYTPAQMNPFTKVYNEQYLEGSGLLVSPRIGFAYDVLGNGKMAIRGGFGMFFDRTGGDDGVAQPLQVPPVQNLTTIWYSTIPQIQSTSPTYGPSSGSYQTRSYQTSYSQPGSYNWSLGVQRDIGLGLVFDVSYVGTVGRHRSATAAINALKYGDRFKSENINPETNMVYPDDFLRRYQGYGSISYTKFDGNSNYHSMQMTLNRRFGTRLTITTNYTWSKAMDYEAGGGGPGPPGGGGEVYFLGRDIYYGKGSGDHTHNLLVNWTYKIPSLSSRMGNNFIARGVFDGWQFSGIGTFISGAPQGVSYSLSGGWPPPDLTGSDGAPTRVNVTGSAILSNPTGLQSRLNTSAISLPKATATYCDGTPSNCGLGNAAKDVFRGPGTNNWDFTLFKDIYFGKNEARSIQIRWEMYNAFNHTQYNSVDTSATFQTDGTQINTTFGQYTNAADPRIMVLAAKLKF
jgi:hypothetical protein